MTSKPLPSVVVAWVGAFVASLSTSLVAIAAPRMARDFESDLAGVGWVLTIYLLGLSASLATAGRLADVLGRKRVYVAGFVLFTVASAACAFAPSLPFLVGARAFQALGASALMATGPAIVTKAFPPEKRARALGIQLTGNYLALTLGPPLGGVLTKAIGWQAVFALVAVAAFAGTIVAIVLLPNDEPAKTSSGGASRLDGVGAVLFGVGLVGLSVALRGHALVPAWAWLGAGIVALVLYARHAKRHPAPVVSLALARSRTFVFGVVGAMLLYVVTFILGWLLPFRLQNELHLDPRHAGLLVTAQPAMLVIVAPLSGALADRVGSRILSVVAMLVFAVGLGLLAVAPTERAIVIALAVCGTGSGLYVAPNNAVIMGAAPRDQQGTAAAMAATARNFGMACGVAIAVALRSRLDFAHAIAVAVVIAVVGAGLSAARPAGDAMVDAR